MKSHKSSLDVSLKTHTQNMFDSSSIQTFATRMLKKRSLMSMADSEGKTEELNSPPVINYLNLDQADFPDICTHCD